MLNEKGYHRPTYDETLNEIIKLAKSFFGEDIDTAEVTIFGKFLRILARTLATAYEDQENLYYSRFPNTASGVSLDRLCVFAGISRNPATYAELSVKVTGEAGTEVEEIKVCGKNTEIVFHNIAPFIIPESGSIAIPVECETAGESGNVSDISEVVNPIAGIDSVAYEKTITQGEDVESDYDLRKRFSLAVEGSGSGNINAIRAAILRVPTVVSAGIIVNDTDATDAKGRPSGSFECFVYGGEDYEQEIAEAIFDKAPLGIKTCSTSDNPVTKTVADDGGFLHTISFSHTENVPIYIKIKLKTNSSFEDDGEAQISKAIADYINGLGVGAEVILSKLYSYIDSVNGVVDVTEITSSTDNVTFAAENISVEDWQVAFTSTANITIEVA